MDKKFYRAPQVKLVEFQPGAGFLLDMSNEGLTERMDEETYTW